MKKIWLSLLAVILMGTAALAAYEKALELFQAKKYKESLNIVAGDLSVERDMEADSPNYRLRYLAAHNHWQLGNHDAAVSHFKRCIEIRKDDTAPFIDISYLLIEMKRYRDAETYLDRAMRIKKEPMIYFLLGEAARGNGNLWKAKELYEKAIAIDPELYISYNGLGIVLMRLGKYTQANTAFSAGLALAPQSPEILNNIGLSLLKIGKTREAYEYLKKAGAANPKNPFIDDNLASVKLKFEALKKND